MERIMVVAYRPYKGKEEILKSLLFAQIKVFRDEGLLSGRDPWFMRSNDALYLGFYEWKSKEVVDGLEANPKVQQLWMQFDKICSFEKPASVPELQQLFTHFESISVS